MPLNDAEGVDEPADAFAEVADPIRLSILWALWDAEGHQLTFSALRDAVGVRDSGQFNYHLGKLTDRFVRKTDDGYELRLAGISILGSILAGTYSGTATTDPIQLEEPCPFCGSQLTFRYESEWVTVDCASCGNTALRIGVPPGVFSSYEPADWPVVAQRYGRTFLHQAREGFCAYCEGRMRPRVHPIGDEVDEHLGDLSELPRVEYACERCGEELSTDLGTALLDHPAVAAFHYEHGVDVREASLWEFVAVDEDQVRIVATDPLEARVEYRVGSATLALIVDESLRVIDVSRSTASG